MKTLILIIIFFCSIPALSKDLFDLTNELRTSLKLNTLKEDPDLQKKACGHSKDMHDGRCGWFRVICHKYSPENVAMTSNTRLSEDQAAQTLFNMWVKSRGHYRNMVGPYSKAGMGIYRGRKGYFGTQIFKR